jgi:hypothetical protein
MFKNSSYLKALVFSILVSVSACTGIDTPPPSKTELPSFFIHTLSPGETLGQLSIWYTGSETHWKDFFIRAPDGDKHKLRVGGLVLIPEHLLVRRDKPTKSFVKKARKKVNSGAASPPAESLMDVIIEEPVEQTQNNLENAENQKQEKLEDDFLGQLIDSTKLHSNEDELNQQETANSPSEAAVPTSTSK